MDRCMDGWIDRSMDGWMDRWIDGLRILEGVCLVEVPLVCIAKHAPHLPFVTIRHPKAERAGLRDVTNNNIRGAGRLSQAQVEERVTGAVVLHDGDVHARCTEWVDACTWMHGWMLA